MTDHHARLETVRQAARAASDYLREAMWDDHEVTAKGAYDLSLAADAEAGRRIAQVIDAAFPGEFVLEEDGPDDPMTGEWVWIVDPLDGTVNYHHRLPWFCVSVACYHRTEASDHPLWRHGRPVASTVIAPVWAQEFWSLAGEGAWSSHRRLTVTDQPLGSSLLSFSRGSLPEDQRFMRGLMERLGASARKTRSHGAAALDLAFVAQGSLGGHLQRSLKPWDIAAGVQLVLEAGGVVEIDPAPSATHHVLAAGRKIGETLLKEWRCDL
jgi:fructose-1,6-bisphosphatase/inositol monophosphatase family enzyme